MSDVDLSGYDASHAAALDRTLAAIAMVKDALNVETDAVMLLTDSTPESRAQAGAAAYVCAQVLMLTAPGQEFAVLDELRTLVLARETG